jgi:hypothetical protein
MNGEGGRGGGGGGVGLEIFKLLDNTQTKTTTLSVSSPVVSPSSALKSDSGDLMLSHFRSTVLGHSCVVGPDGTSEHRSS